jgi:predicted nucleotide-binding protein (sugar kinase/HSP70/actin superfamily)
MAITTKNMNDLLLLCEEFGFAALLSKVSAIQAVHSVVDDESRKRISGIEDQYLQHERTLCFLQEQIAELREEASLIAKTAQRLTKANKERKRAITALQEQEESHSLFRDEVEAVLRFLAESNKAHQESISMVFEEQGNLKQVNDDQNLSLEREICQLQGEIGYLREANARQVAELS